MARPRLVADSERPTIHQGFRVSLTEKTRIDQLKMAYGLRLGQIIGTRELMMAALEVLADRVGYVPETP